MIKIFNFFIKRPILAGIVVVCVAIGVFWYSAVKQKEPSFSVAVAGKGTVVEEVSVTGKVQSADTVDLAFEMSGKVSRVYVRVGETVNVGQPLVQLQSSELAVQLAQAEANVKSQEAKLDELRRGTRPEEMRVQETKAENARIALEDAKKNLVDKLQDAYTKADDAVRNKSDQCFGNPRSSSPQISFQTTDAQLKTDIEEERPRIESTLAAWSASADALTIASNLSGAVAATEKNLTQVRLFLDKVALALSSVVYAVYPPQATLDRWKSDVSTARTNIGTAIMNLQAAEEKLRSAEANLTLAGNELALKKAGTAPEQIAVQEAQVAQALANAQNYRIQLAKATLRSPLEGTVTKQNAKIGEFVSLNASVVSLISEAKFEIEANVPEADIAKVKVGNPANVTLDAYGNDVVFETTVTAIDPAETIIEGVATYKVTLQFAKEDERIKSGMTANIDIIADKHENVIVIPQRAVTTKNGEKTVLVDTGKAEPEERRVTTGIRGSDGNVEITDGIREGERVITFLKAK